MPDSGALLNYAERDGSVSPSSPTAWTAFRSWMSPKNVPKEDYGSDIGGRSFASQLAKVQGADISDQAKRRILGENLKRLLLPILRDKGVRV